MMTAVAPIADTSASFSVTVDRAALATELALCATACAKRSSTLILANVLLEIRDGRLYLRATDIELTVFTSLESSSDGDDGSATVLLDDLSRFVKATTDDSLSITCSGGFMMLQSGTAKLKLPTLPSDDFPADPRKAADADATIATLPLVTLKAMLHSTDYAAATEGIAQLNLQGCVIAGVGSVFESFATDGCRMSFASASETTLADASTPRLIPNRAVASIQHLEADDDAEAVISASLNGISVTCGVRTLYHRAVDANIPNWRNSVPKTFGGVAEVSVPDLLAAVRRTSIAASERTKAIRFAFTPGRLKLSASDATKVAEEQIPIDYSGPVVTVDMDSGYVSSVLGVIGSERVRVSIPEGVTEQATGAVRFDPVGAPDDDEQFHIVMTMRMA